MHRVPEPHLETTCATCATSLTSSSGPRDRAETGIQNAEDMQHQESVLGQTHSPVAHTRLLPDLENHCCIAIRRHCLRTAGFQHFQMCPYQLKFFGIQRSRHPHIRNSLAARHAKTPCPNSASARQRPKRRQMSGIKQVGNPDSQGHWTLHPDVRNLAQTSSVEIGERQHCAVHANVHFPNVIARVFASNLHI